MTLVIVTFPSGTNSIQLLSMENRKHYSHGAHMVGFEGIKEEDLLVEEMSYPSSDENDRMQVALPDMHLRLSSTVYSAAFVIALHTFS